MPAELILLEGPDCCGKSTLLKSLETRLLKSQAYHHGPYSGEGPASLMRHYLAPMRNGYVSLLYDRGWLSEPIYGRVKRNGSDRLGAVGRRFLERVALGCRGVIVIPEATYDQCLATYLARKEMEYLDDETQFKAVFNAYDHLTSDLPILRVPREWSLSEVMARIEALRAPANHGPGIGRWHQSVTVLVGESAANPADADLPFVAPDLARDNCSYWLAERLEEAGIKESELYWVNAFDGRGRPTDPTFLERLNPTRVIALGQVADTWCGTMAHVAHDTVPHPQYWKRFHHGKSYPLIQRLI